MIEFPFVKSVERLLTLDAPPAERIFFRTPLENIGKLLIIIGLVSAGAGVLLWVLGRAGFRGLPGDIDYQGDSVRVVFPIVTSIVISLLVTGAIWLWQWLARR